MNWQNEKDRKAFFSVGLLGLAVLMMGFTAAEIINIARGDQPPLLTRETLKQIRPDKAKTRQYLDQYQKAADDLTQNNMFVPPPDTSEPPGDCTAIFGDEARIGNRWVKAGDMFGDAEVVAVGPTSVTLLWEGRRITRAPVLKLEEESNRRSSGAGSARNRRDQGGRPQRVMGRGNMGRGGMRGGRGGGPASSRGENAGDQLRSFMQQEGGQMVRDFMNMSNDQRVRAIEDMRRQFQGGQFEIRTSGSGSGTDTMQTFIIRGSDIRR